MGDLLEVVFENTGPDAAYAMLNKLSAFGSNVRDYSVSFGEPNQTAIDWSNIKNLFDVNTEDISLFVNLKNFNMYNVIASTCSVQVIRYGKSYDVNIIVDIDDFKNLALPKIGEILQRMAQAIAAEFGIYSYFCGLEPARDMETRLFTRDQIGQMCSRAEA